MPPHATLAVQSGEQDSRGGPGFTTREGEGGHGLGLHSSALAARSLGGSLALESDGPGKGATALLELPLGAERGALG